MKKTLLILICIASSYYITAQETTKQKEVGLVFNSLNNFGVTYKTGTYKSLWRFTSLFVNGNDFKQTIDTIDNINNSFGFGLKFGKEFRKNINTNLEFRYGADISFTYSKSKQNVDSRELERVYYTPGFNLVFGLNYVLGENFIIGAELMPEIAYLTGTETRKYNGEEEKVDISRLSYGFDSSSVLITLAYRFD